MTKTKSAKHHKKVALLSIILGAGMLFTACDKAPQNQTIVPPKATPGLENSTKQAQEKARGILPLQIAKETDVFALHALKQEYEQGKEQSEDVEQAFAGLFEALTKKMKPRTLTPGLDFLAVDTKATGDQEYTFSFLLKTSADLDTDYHLSVQGFVFLANAPFLPEAQRERQYASWTKIIRETPTSLWKKGTYHVVHLKTTKAALIPYNLKMSLHTRNEQGRYAARVGAILTLGWQWAALNEGTFISKIEACKTPAELYALAPAGPKVSASLAQALEKKWRSLTADIKPQTLIEGLDCLAVDTKVTGEKEFTFSFLLHPTADLDTDYHLSVTAFVDPSHRQHIKPAKPGGLYTTWSLLFYNDPTSQWKSGEYHVAQIKIETEIIPYNLSLMLQTRNERRRWIANLGNRIPLGWQMAVPE